MNSAAPDKEIVSLPSPVVFYPGQVPDVRLVSEHTSEGQVTVVRVVTVVGMQ